MFVSCTDWYIGLTTAAQLYDMIHSYYMYVVP